MAYDGSAWNEAAPVNNDLAADIDDYIRDLKIGVRSRMANEHGWRDSQTATGSDGYHKFVSLTTQTSQPGLVYGTATQAGAIYAISSGTGVSVCCRNSAGYEMTLGHSAYTGGGIVPKGGIIMWSGTVANIPFGWALCDGGSGTPDLRDRFVICATQDDGGVAKTNVTGSLTQTGGSATHVQTEDELAAHSHNSVLELSGGGATPTILGTTSATTQNRATSTTGSSDPMDIMNPYYALAFIMKL